MMFTNDTVAGGYHGHKFVAINLKHIIEHYLAVNLYEKGNFHLLRQNTGLSTKQTWTKHAEGRSNLLRHSPVTTFHNTTLGENELIRPVREQVAARIVLLPELVLPVADFGFCSILTQLIGWQALIEWILSQDGKLQTFIRHPKQPEMNISLLLSTSETINNIEVHEWLKLTFLMEIFLPEYEITRIIVYLPIHLHVQGNAFRLLMLKDWSKKLFYPLIQLLDNCLEFWFPTQKLYGDRIHL